MVKRTAARPEPPPPRAAPAGPPARRWLLFVHQLPASPSNLRVRTWRRLQQVGAVPLKQAVYALPDTPSAREDLEWLKAEVTAAGGEASVFAATTVDGWSDDALVAEFRRVRQHAYLELASEIEEVIRRGEAARRPRGGRRPALARLADGFRARLAALEQVDFFGSAGRDRVVSLLARLDEQARPPRPSAAGPASGRLERAAFRGRLWVTRPRPGVDRMSSAWLIRQFIDASARFGFAPDRDSLPDRDAIPFDMFGVDFSHQGDDCTFETLCRVFGIDDPAVSRIAGIVHDLDLKDGRFGLPDTGTVGTLIDGLQLATTEDLQLLERGMTLFESLYLAFAGAIRLKGPREVTATPPARSRRSRQARPARARRRR